MFELVVYAPSGNIPIPIFHSQNGRPKPKWEKWKMEKYEKRLRKIHQKKSGKNNRRSRKNMKIVRNGKKLLRHMW